MTAERAYRERVLARLRAGDALRLRTIRQGGTSRVRLAFPDGETVHHLTVESLVRRGEVTVEDGTIVERE